MTYLALAFAINTPELAVEEPLVLELQFLKRLPRTITWGAMKKSLPTGTTFKKEGFFAGEGGIGNRVNFHGQFEGHAIVISEVQARTYRNHIVDGVFKGSALNLTDSSFVTDISIHCGHGKMRESKNEAEYLSRLAKIQRVWGKTKVDKWEKDLDALGVNWPNTKLSYMDYSAVNGSEFSLIGRTFATNFKVN